MFTGFCAYITGAVPGMSGRVIVQVIHAPDLPTLANIIRSRGLKATEAVHYYRHWEPTYE